MSALKSSKMKKQIKYHKCHRVATTKIGLSKDKQVKDQIIYVNS